MDDSITAEEFVKHTDEKVIHHIHHSYAKIVGYDKEIEDIKTRLIKIEEAVNHILRKIYPDKATYRGSVL